MSNYGERNGRAKLTDHECELILFMRTVEKMSYGIIAKKFEVSKTQVYNICVGKYRGVA